MANLLSRLFQKKASTQDQMRQIIQAQVNRYLEQNISWRPALPVYPDIDQRKAVEEGYAGNDDVYSIVSMKAQMASHIPFYLYKVKGKEGQKSLREYKQLMNGDCVTEEGLFKASLLKTKAMEQVDDSNDLSRLLANPSPYCSASEFYEYVYGFLNLTGNAYIGKERLSMGANQGKVKNLYTLPSQWMEIVPDGGWPISVAGYIFFLWGQQGIPADEVIHIKYFNPVYKQDASFLYGLSPLQAGKKTLVKSSSAEDSEIAQYQHGGPAGMVYNESIDPGDVNEHMVGGLKKKWEAETWGNKNRGKVMFSAGKLGYLQTGLSPVDLGILQVSMPTFRKLCRLWKMPSPLFNDSEYATLSNMKEYAKMAYTNAIIPDVIKVRDAQNRSLLPDFKMEGQYYIDADFTNVSALQQDMKTLSEWLNLSPEITLNERRELKMFERLPDKNMDKVYVQSSLVPLDDLSMQAEDIGTDIEELNKAGANPYK